MNFLTWLWIAFLYGISYLPMPVLHFLSDLTYLLVYYVFKYRRGVVRENLEIAFPEMPLEGRKKIEKKFFRNFCDLIFEAIKTFTISADELRKRCVFKTPELVHQLWLEKKNCIGVSSHLANWEWKGLSLGYEFEFPTYVVYKPLSSVYLNTLVVRSRERFGAKLVPIQKLREVFDQPTPVMIGLLSDQAPHDYSKAFEVEFLGRKTWITPGAGVLSVQKNFTAIWGWMRRTGRSKYEWGVELLDDSTITAGWIVANQAQLERISNAHGIALEQAQKALAITEAFTKKLEAEIKMAPQDWLWSHRRWKNR